MYRARGEGGRGAGLPGHKQLRRLRRPRAPSFGLLLLLLTLTTFLHRPVYETWSFVKIYWIRIKHPTPRPPPLCAPDTPPAVDLGLLLDYPVPQDTPWQRYAGSVALPRDGRPNVVLVTLCDAALADLCDASVDNKRAYAARHGYELLVANDMIDPSRPAAWSKILAVRAAFDRGAELVACLDADTLIMNPLVRLEELFDWRFEQLLGADHNGPNSGVWLIRRSEWSVAFLEALWHEGTRYVSMAPLRSIFRYEQRAFHYLFQSAAWRRRIGDRYEGANGVRVRTKLVHQCVLNSLPSFYTPGDFVLHLAGIKGAVKCLMFRRYYLAAAAAAGLTPGVDAVRPSSAMRCLCGSPIAG